jgi:hypothetical protein
MKQSVLRVEQLEDRCLPSANVVLEWNQLALHAVGQARLSPVAASRALAITAAAVYDSVVAIDGSFELYHAQVHASHGASLEAAAAQAAHDTLTALLPAQATTFDSALAADLVGIPPGQARQGVEVGHEVAQQILDWRSTDGSSATVAYTPGTDPGDWQPTPPANLPALAPQWPYVTPFAMTSGSQFRPAPPPALDSAEYATAFNEVKDLGRADSTTRTDEQTQIAKFWNDGLGTAFAMGYWNRIAAQVVTDQGLGLVQDARVFALVNIAEADAHIACWDAKYTYNLWRPVTAIRAADTDGNPDTEPDATWTPLLVTPNFPSYMSAHSTLSAAAAGVLTSLFGHDYHFTVGAESVTYTRSFASFDAAAAEAGQSRIYGGIHYQFDNQAAQTSGHAVGLFVVDNFLRPAEEHEADSRHDDRADDHPQGRDDSREKGLALFLVGPCGASSAYQGMPDGQATLRQPLQPSEMRTATGVVIDQPIQHAAARDRLAARALQLQTLEPALADLDDSVSAEVLQGDVAFARAR